MNALLMMILNEFSSRKHIFTAYGLLVTKYAKDDKHFMENGKII